MCRDRLDYFHMRTHLHMCRDGLDYLYYFEVLTIAHASDISSYPELEGPISRAFAMACPAMGAERALR